MVKNLAAQLLGIGVEVVGAESVLREAFASAGTLLRRPDMNAEFAAGAIFWIAERPGYPRRIRGPARPFPVWRPVRTKIAKHIRGSELPRDLAAPEVRGRRVFDEICQRGSPKRKMLNDFPLLLRQFVC